MIRQDNLLVSILPNKGNIADAIQGDKNLIAMVINYHTATIILDSKLKEAEENDSIIGSVTKDKIKTHFCDTKYLFRLKTS